MFTEVKDVSTSLQIYFLSAVYIFSNTASEPEWKAAISRRALAPRSETFTLPHFLNVGWRRDTR